ncbi:unnamed protein product [Miscanthus lutarioriparius]|uniref:Uncharacterized protein n=1 Tax=Miscanthus lutarioriparius TaxID=422564 RepID=A0A811S962_9POAL|nr:unnamed protein product [Miscanthus lutarioriparius]
MVPQLGVLTPAASVLPLAFVLGVTAVKDAYEDWRRHRSYKNENNRTASVLVGGVFVPKRWKEVQAWGSDPTGVAYVQTINLDGESNLKTRYAKQETMPTPAETLAGVIKCERPNRNLYGFLATVDLDGRRAVSLGPSNILLRGCELKNTAWAIGVAVYTGRDTKVMIPIALYISMEIVRVGQAFFMVQDKNVFDDKRQAKFQCRALNINEDLLACLS